MIVYENDFFILMNEAGVLHIKTRKLGFDVKEFNRIASGNPTLHITNFASLKDALHEIREDSTVIGVVKPEIEIRISPDKMEARVVLNISAKRFEEDRSGFAAKIAVALNENKVIFGLDNISDKPFTVQREIVIAHGKPAQDGIDSEIHLYEIKDKKPQIKEDGKANYYELSLIESVAKGDWLGEMTPPTEGVPGMNVMGEVVPPKPGKVKKLLYDPKTVAAYEEDGRTVLRALTNGALRIDNGKVKIDDLLVIKGDVDYVTGNITFGGSVSIQGTVLDNFSVVANGDISINSPLGVGAVGRIESIFGSVYIKGGVFGKSIAKIKAEKDVFLKYCNETEVLANGDINIGFYALNSTLTAQNIILDQTKGRIIGGTATAVSSIVSGTVGNVSEIHTYLVIKGFDRERTMEHQAKLIEAYQKLRQETAQVRLKLNGIESKAEGANLSGDKEYMKLKETYETSIREIIRMEHEQKKIKQVLATKGEGSLVSFKGIHGKTHLTIKGLNKYFEEFTSGTIYYSHGELIQE